MKAPARKTSTPRDGAARRADVIAAAIVVMAERGYAGASLREVASAAGIEKGHLTYYFRTKDDLLHEIVGDLHQRFLDGFGRWVGPTPEAAPVQLARVLTGHVELVCALHRQTQVAYENMRFLTPARRRAVGEERRRYEAGLADLIDRSRPALDIVDLPTSLLTKAVLGVVNWPYHWYTPGGRETAPEIARIMTDRALALLRR